MAKNLTISEFMTTNVAHVDADEKILAIAKKMRRKNISCVMVLEKKAETSQENTSNDHENDRLVQTSAMARLTSARHS